MNANCSIYANLDDELPVKLVSFSGTTRGQDALLSWKTSSETNNSGFQIEHSMTGSDFEQIGFVEGQGSTLETQYYDFAAADLFFGKNYFRLIQVDYDGTSTPTSVIELNIDVAGEFELEAAYPNPFNPQTVSRFAAAETQEVIVELFDSLGRKLRTLFSGEAEANQQYQLTISLADRSAGQYLL